MLTIFDELERTRFASLRRTWSAERTCSWSSSLFGDGSIQLSYAFSQEKEGPERLDLDLHDLLV